MPELHDLFTSSQFIPHGHCYLWKPGLVWLHVLSDSLIALAYYSIPLLLLYIVRQRGDLPFNGIFLLFGSFIIACGTGHVLDVWTLWHPIYWLSGLVKAITALVSLSTAAVLVLLIPKILTLPSPAQLEAANLALTNEIKERWRVEEMLQLVMENMPQFMFWKDKNLVYQGCNRNFARAAGFTTSEEVIGKTDYELPWTQEESGFFRKCDARVMATNTPQYHIIETQLRADGTQTWLDTNKVPLHDAEGHVVGILGTYEDITARKLAEAQLEKALQQLTFHVENSPLAVVEWDKDFRLRRWSKQAEKIFGWKAEEVIGLSSSEWQFVVESDQESVSWVMSALLQSKEPRHVQLNRNYTKDKRVVHCEWYSSALLDESGNLVSILSQVLDVTDRELASSALREKEERYRAVVEQTSEGILLVDADTKCLLEANLACQNSLGYTGSEILSLTLYDILALDREIVDQNARRIRKAKHGYIGEAQHRCKNGLILDVEIRANLISYGGREVFCIVFSDVTERKQAELALRHSEAQLRNQAKQQELLNCLANQIRSSLDLDTILQTTVQEIRSLLQIDRCHFAWYFPDAEQPAWEVVKEARNPALPSRIGRYLATAIGPFKEQPFQQEIIQVDDVQTLNNPVLHEFLLQLGYMSIVGMPIHCSGKSGMVVCGHCSRSRPWSDGEVELLKAVSDQLAIAINQASLYTQSQSDATRATAQATQLEKTLKELQQTQTHLIQSEKMSSLGQMVAGVAHEINNPVNFIYGNLVHVSEYTQDLLHLLHLYQKHYPQPSAEVQRVAEGIDLDFLRQDLLKILSSMKVGAERIRQIVLSLRNFSRLDEAEVKYVNIHEGIDSTLLILHHRLKEKAAYPPVKLIKEYGELPLVECYAGQLNQVFMNILSNAIDALEERLQVEGSQNLQVKGLKVEGSHFSANLQPLTSFQPIIRIRTEVHGKNQVIIRIADNGCGITEEVRHKLFDPFFTTKPVGRGTGLGLSISYQIVVQRHKGVLRCISAPGQGAEFVIKIPIRQQH